jgi:hypothetical protein
MASPIITMTHYIFLTREQRYALSIPDSEIDVIGHCIPIWTYNGNYPSKIPDEVFAKYKIKHCLKKEQQTVNLINGGFLIRFSPNIPRLLLDFRDCGVEHVILTHQNVVNTNDKVIPIVHFLNVEDIGVFEATSS